MLAGRLDKSCAPECARVQSEKKNRELQLRSTLAMRLSASLSALGGAAIILFRYGMSLAPHRKVLGALPRRGMRSVQRYIAAPDWPLCSSFGRTSSRGLDLVEFRRLGLVDSLIDGLRDQGFREPSPIQRAAKPQRKSQRRQTRTKLRHNANEMPM